MTTLPSRPLAVWRAYDDASNAGDHDTAARYLAPDLAVLVNGEAAVASIEEDRAIQSELLAIYPDYRREYIDGTELGDLAVVEWRMRGTSTDETFADLEVAGVSIVRCVDGKLVSARLYHPTGVLDLVTARALARLNGV